MSLLVNLYDSRALTAAINLMKVPEPFLMDKVFTVKEPHNSDKIDVELITSSEKIAQFTAPDDPKPKAAKKLTKTVQTVTIPRTYESKIFSAKELADISIIGDIYPNDADKKQAQQERIAQEMEDLKNRVIRLREKMACEAISTGKITSDGDIKFAIDFGFVNDVHLLSLSGDDRWNQTDSSPLAQIKLWKRKIMQRCGVNPTIMIMGSNACDAFIGNVDVRKKLDAANFRVGTIDLNGSNDTRTASYIGPIEGMDVYEYAQQYKDSADTLTDMYDADTVSLIAPSSSIFKVHNGAIYRVTNGIVVPIYGDFYLEIDKQSGDQFLQWNLEQKSLPTIHDPGNVITVTVLNDSET